MLYVILLAIAAVLIAYIVAGFSGAPWVPSRERDLEAFFRAAKLDSGITFCDLGCGDGKTVLMAARTGATAIGLEINPLFWLLAKLRTRKTPNATIYLANLWGFNLGNVDVVMVFLMPRFMPRLALKLQQELKPGAQVISYVFEIPARQPVQSSNNTYRYQY